MFLHGKQILLAKEEGTYAVDPTPVVGSNAIPAENIQVSYEADVLERNQMRGDLSPVAPVMGKRSVKISFEVELKGSGAAGTAAILGDLLEACGLAETVSAGVAVSYAPSSGVMKSVTFYHYELQDSGSAILHKITGARGTFALNAEAGQIAKLNFTFNGLYVLPVNAAAPSVPTFESTKPPIVESVGLTLNGVTSLVVQGISVDMQNQVTASDDISSAGGIKSFNITGRKPTGKLTPEAVSMAVYDFWSDWIAATERAASALIGSVAGNKVLVSAPRLTIDSISPGERAGVRTRELPFRLNRSAGNDEISLIFS